MTPKEKAEELVKRFEDGITIKDCALIAVDEIINCDYFFKTLEDTKGFTDYWYRVQQEIEKS